MGGSSKLDFDSNVNKPLFSPLSLICVFLLLFFFHLSAVSAHRCEKLWLKAKNKSSDKGDTVTVPNSMCCLYESRIHCQVI